MKKTQIASLFSMQEAPGLGRTLPKVPPSNVGWCQLQEAGQAEVGMLRNSGMASKSGRLRPRGGRAGQREGDIQVQVLPPTNYRPWGIYFTSWGLSFFTHDQ